METESVVNTLRAELEKHELSTDEKKRIMRKLMEDYSAILAKSYEKALQRCGDISMLQVYPEDVAVAAADLRFEMIGSARVREAIDDSSEYLREIGQDGKWGWWSWIDPPDLKSAITKIWSTALTIRSLIRAGVSSTHPQIAKGISWLLDNKIQNQPASWARLPAMYVEEHNSDCSVPNTYETCCVLLTLLEISEVQTSVRQIVFDAIKNLVAKQHEKGYWSALLTEEMHLSGQPDNGATSMALKTITRAKNHGFETADGNRAGGKATEWLKSQQRICGAWGDTHDEVGNTSKTSDVIRALAESDELKNRENIDKGAEWLIRNQGIEEDGKGWGWRRTDQAGRLVASNIENTAAALIALLRAGYSPDAAPIQGAAVWLLHHMNNDNWSADTPRVILALCEYLRVAKLKSETTKGTK